MLQWNSNHTISSTSVSRLTSCLSSMTPRNKAIISSALVLAILFVVSLVSAASRGSNGYLQQPGGLTGNTSVNVETVTNDLLPEVTQGESKVETKVDVSTSTSINGDEVSPQVELKVNGQDIAIPENGQVSETVTGSANEGMVEVNVHSSSTQSDDSDSTRIRIDSETESEVRIRSSN